jgi:hypothetical protein
VVEEKVQINIRIPVSIHDKILKIVNKNNKTKTDVIVAILEKFFSGYEDMKKDFSTELEEHYIAKEEAVDELDNMFSLGEKIFMSKKVYKQILQKSESKIEYEIKTGIIDSTQIAGIDFVIIESALDTNSIVVEQILQKKEIANLKRRVDIIESRI